ncbi:MAG: hypothetical protein SFU57_11650 [Gemmatimonadales bacterium]|nr:hypothetical protein [Gemmatimonadales bacterium]
MGSRILQIKPFGDSTAWQCDAVLLIDRSQTYFVNNRLQAV